MLIFAGSELKLGGLDEGERAAVQQAIEERRRELPDG